MRFPHPMSLTTLCGTPEEALEAYAADPNASIMTDGQLYLVGPYPEVALAGCEETCPEALEAIIRGR